MYNVDVDQSAMNTQFLWVAMVTELRVAQGDIIINKTMEVRALEANLHSVKRYFWKVRLNSNRSNFLLFQVAVYDVLIANCLQCQKS